jgi:hypothetical protein
MASLKLAYGTSASLTNAVASLATSSTWTAGYESAVVDNTSNLYVDYSIEGYYTVGTTPTTATEIRIYVVASWDGSSWPDVFDGTTGAETVTSEGVRDGFAKLAAVLRCDSATSNRAYPFSFTVASLFGGICPPKFVLFTAHNTATNFNSTGGNQVTRYRGAYLTSA